MGHENNGACDPVVATVSWPGLARPPTTLPPPAPPVVDGRHMAGHDTRGTSVHELNAHADNPGHDEQGTWRRPYSGHVPASLRFAVARFRKLPSRRQTGKHRGQECRE